MGGGGGEHPKITNPNWNSEKKIESQEGGGYATRGPPPGPRFHFQRGSYCGPLALKWSCCLVIQTLTSFGSEAQFTNLLKQNFRSLLDLYKLYRLKIILFFKVAVTTKNSILVFFKLRLNSNIDSKSANNTYLNIIEILVLLLFF